MGTQIFDQYSLLHFAVGIIFYFFNISFKWWTILHILFEYSENTTFGMNIINKYLTFWPGNKNYADSLLNNIGDIIVGSIGWLIARVLDSYGNRYGWFERHIHY